MADTTYRPETAWAVGATDSAIWSEYRQIMSGRSDQVAKAYLARYYPQAYERGKLRVLYLPLVHYVDDVAAGAFDLPLRVEGPLEAGRLIQSWRPVLARAWRVRKNAGSAFLHLARRRRLRLEMLWGDALEVQPDAIDPLEWEAIPRLKIAMNDNRSLVYERLVDGTVRPMQEAAGGTPLDLAAGPVRPVLPVFPLYREAYEGLQPPPDRTLLDLWVTLAMQLSDVEFRRVYRTSILWRKDAGVIEGRAEMNPDLVWELSQDGAMGIVESGLRPADDLIYIEDHLRLAARLMRLPPELFVTRSRAETGAAKEWDYRPLLELQEADRAEADRWLDEWVTYSRPLLEAEKVIGPRDRLSIRTTPPKLAEPADLLQYAQGVEAAAKLGLTSVEREVARREGIAIRAAALIVETNRRDARKLGPAPAPAVLPPADDPDGPQ